MVLNQCWSTHVATSAIADVIVRNLKGTIAGREKTTMNGMEAKEDSRGPQQGSFLRATVRGILLPVANTEQLRVPTWP